MPGTRAASHAGSWYTADGQTLRRELEGWLQERSGQKNSAGVRGVIAPHAGFRYSGPVAASAYVHLDLTGAKRVFILGPSHHYYLRGCALSQMDYYETPVGNLTLDKAVIEELAATGRFEWMEQDQDEEEHSIEMHLPYVALAIGRAAADIKVVPILVGALSTALERDYGKLLAKYLDDPANRFVVSSDFCHWGSRFSFTAHEAGAGPIHASIEALDRAGMELIARRDTAGFAEYLKKTQNTICGRHPIAVFLNAMDACRSSYAVRFVDYAQSSKVTDKRDSSVSYAAALATAA
eukprot:tig00020684_g12901.t1